MIKRKGMSMAMNIVIVIIVLVVIALLVIGITRGQIFGGLGFLQNQGDKQECAANRDMYCQNNPSGCWAASEESIIKEGEEEGTLCNEILGIEKNGSYFYCKYNEYIHKDGFPLIDKEKTVDEFKENDEGKTKLKNICKRFDRYWDNEVSTCNESKGSTETVDLTFLETLRCNSLN